MIAGRLAWANPDHVTIEAGNFVIEEVDEAGAGRVEFANSAEALVWRGRRTPPISWVAERKCADGIVLADASKACVLYLIELKNAVGIHEITKIQSQFSGAYMNFIALAAVVEAKSPDTIELIVAFKRDKIASLVAANPSLAKPISGPEGVAVAEWLGGMMSVRGLGTLPVRKVKRDAVTGDGSTIL